jgi:hypothetical protein
LIFKELFINECALDVSIDLEIGCESSHCEPPTVTQPHVAIKHVFISICAKHISQLILENRENKDL